MDFQKINEAALAQCLPLLEQLLPGGRLVGREYTCGDLSGGSGKSCKVNVASGRWSDFATGQSGGDLISLVAEIEQISQGDAARRLMELCGIKADQGEPKPVPRVIMPVPASAPPPDMTHWQLGAPVCDFTYHDQQGRIIGYTGRYDLAEFDENGKRRKEFRPRTFTDQGWRWQGFPEPLPFYGLERLGPDLPLSVPVLTVEGEAAADALHAALGRKCPVLSIHGGSKKAGRMDVSPLAGRRVIIWPDNDEPGAKAAQALAGLLAGVAESVRILKIPEGKPDTWDCRNAIEDDAWDYDALVAYIKDNQIEPVQQEQQEAVSKAASLVVVDVVDFMQMELPRRKYLLDPVLAVQGLAMLHACRGLGKTFMALSIAWAVASGGSLFDRWQAPAPARVLLIDGEMSALAQQERIAMIGASASSDIQSRGNFRLLTPDLQSEPMPNLAAPAGQVALERFTAEADLIILDNIATLCRAGRANEEESWQPIQDWLLSLRRQGKSVLLIHHSGKNGSQRGTSAKEDVLDTVIDLRRPADYEASQGCRVEVHITKGRGLVGDAAKPFEAWLEEGKWKVRDIEESQLEQIEAMKAGGMNQREIGAALGISASKVCRQLKKAGLEAR